MQKTVTAVTLFNNKRLLSIEQTILYLLGFLFALAWMTYGTWVFYSIGSGIHSDLVMVFLAFYIPALIGTIGLGWPIDNQLFDRQLSQWHSIGSYKS